MRKAVAAAVFFLMGAASLAACPAGLVPMRQADLYFGHVGEADWRDFLAREVTPRFPAGLTVEDAAGQWRDARGVIVREASKHLILVLGGAPDEAVRLAAIRRAFKRHFHQQSVLLVEHPVCGSF